MCACGVFLLKNSEKMVHTAVRPAAIRSVHHSTSRPIDGNDNSRCLLLHHHDTNDSHHTSIPSIAFAPLYTMIPLAILTYNRTITS